MPVVATTVDVADDKVLREIGDIVRGKLSKPGVVVLAHPFDQRVTSRLVWTRR